jgi:hypothetical protein
MTVGEIRKHVIEELKSRGCSCDVEVRIFIGEVLIDDEGNTDEITVIDALHEEWCPIATHGYGGNN